MTTVREQSEELERRLLSDRACRSAASKGRRTPVAPCDVRTEFQRDRDRILHSKAFRRLKGKTQVFLAPRGDHYRTRLTHTLEVAQIARTIARGLRLNEDLTEAIALGHDLGHTPFGHAGEAVLDQFHPSGFRHYEQSLRVVDYLENDGRGLNLTHETRDGIGSHSKGTGRIVADVGMPATWEGVVVRFSDVIAYLNHDIEDALRGDVIAEEDLPPEPLRVLGRRRSERISTMVRDIVLTSAEAPTAQMSEEVLAATEALKDFMYTRVYSAITISAEVNKARGLVRALVDYYVDRPEVLPPFYQRIAQEEGNAQAVCDYIAGMTDAFALNLYEELFLPGTWGYS
jgi:dGTPase